MAALRQLSCWARTCWLLHFHSFKPENQLCRFILVKSSWFWFIILSLWIPSSLMINKCLTVWALAFGELDQLVFTSPRGVEDFGFHF